MLYNFRGFLDAGFDDKQLIIEGISKMKEEKNIKMEIVEFDMDLGNLYLKSSGIWYIYHYIAFTLSLNYIYI